MRPSTMVLALLAMVEYVFCVSERPMSGALAVTAAAVVSGTSSTSETVAAYGFGVLFNYRISNHGP